MRVIRTRSIQPDYSPGVLVAALVLIGIISLDWLNWWTLLITLVIAPFTNALLVGRTHRDETTIEKDI